MGTPRAWWTVRKIGEMNSFNLVLRIITWKTQRQSDTKQNPIIVYMLCCFNSKTKAKGPLFSSPPFCLHGWVGNLWLEDPFRSLKENGINTEAISHLHLRSLCLDYVAWKMQFPDIFEGFCWGCWGRCHQKIALIAVFLVGVCML